MEELTYVALLEATNVGDMYDWVCRKAKIRTEFPLPDTLLALRSKIGKKPERCAAYLLGLKHFCLDNLSPQDRDGLNRFLYIARITAGPSKPNALPCSSKVGREPKRASTARAAPSDGSDIKGKRRLHNPPYPEPMIIGPIEEDPRRQS